MFSVKLYDRLQTRDYMGNYKLSPIDKIGIGLCIGLMSCIVFVMSYTAITAIKID